MMNWPQLLTYQRPHDDREEEYKASRPPWQVDFDRIVFSSAFRRLQDKTQVFPLSGSDYVRTRLTHSLEVSTVARTLGTLAGGYILEKYGGQAYGPGKKQMKDVLSPADFGMITAAGALAHDIGNPPFGHSGEDSIRHWFMTSPVAAGIKEKLTPGQAADFEKWEGNAAAFRIIARTQVYKNEGGMRLTAATLGAFAKYPTVANATVSNKDHPFGTSAKKPGVFHEDLDLWCETAEMLGLIKDTSDSLAKDRWCRHPLAYLTEAADDICYRINDLEDGYKLKCIIYEEAKDLLSEVILFGASERENAEEKLAQNLERSKASADKISYLRARCINTLVEQVSMAFEQHEEELLRGQFTGDLLKKIPVFAMLKELEKSTRENAYSMPSVLEVEAAGFEIIPGLLDLFVEAREAYEADENEKERREALKASGGLKGEVLDPFQPCLKSRKIFELIPEEFREGDDPYARLLRIVDFVAGMTDTFALNLYRKLTGVSLPN
jgi:dGTPase